MTKYMNDQEFIAAYFNHRLDDAEKKRFLAKYEEDETFQQSVDEYKIMHHTFTNLSDEATKRIEGIFQKEEEKVKVHQLNTRRTWYIAATVLLLLGIGAVVYFTLPADENPIQVAEKPDTKIEPLQEFQVPLYSSEEALGYTPSEQMAVDSIILFVFDSEEETNTYIFGDTLKLYLMDNNLTPLRIENKDGNYILKTTQGNYELMKGFNQEMELERTEKGDGLENP